MGGAWAAFVFAAGICGLLMVFAGQLVRGVATRAAAGELEPNRVAGIRTQATMASDEAWLAGHRAAAPDSLRAGSVATGSGIAGFAVPGLLGALGTIDAATAMVVWTLVLMIGVFVMLGLLFRATRAANAAAGAVTD